MPIYKTTDRMLMKRIQTFTFWGLFLLCGLLTACSQEDKLLPVDSVPLELHAAGDALPDASTRADNLPENAFDATVVLTTRQGGYSGFAGNYEGYRDVTVGTDGSVTWKLSNSDKAPEYPETGDWLYLVGVSPVAVPSGGNVFYTLTGSEDLLYAKEQCGNRWDGDRFSANTDPMRDKPMEFNHLLARLQFKARKKMAGGQAVTVTGLKVNEAKPQVILPLATGIPAFEGTPGLSLHPGEDGAGVEVPADAGPIVTLGDLLIPPLASGGTYTLDVETSFGNFQNIPIVFADDASAGEELQAGMSHEITLWLTDSTLGILSVTAVPWESVKVDDDQELVP